jgi:hypothetical protein
MYYIRAVGNNRFTGDGTDKWLKIMEIKHNNKGTYTISVKIGNMDKYVDVDPSMDMPNLRFAKGWPDLMPVSFRSILNTLR